MTPTLSPETILETIDHGLTVGQWATYLSLQNHAEYDEPPPPDLPMLAMSREAIVEVYRKRHAGGGRKMRQLWHPEDSWRAGWRFDCLSVAVHRGRNGTAIEDGVVTTRRLLG